LAVGASDPNNVVKDGVVGISIFLISPILSSLDIFSRVVDVIYPSKRDSFNILSKRSIAT
jgi:hypothetical protein